MANYENVTLGPNGAEFTFNKRYDAPYMWTNKYMFFGHVEVVMRVAKGTGMISSAVLVSYYDDSLFVILLTTRTDV